jgi:hypothetical protein
MVRVSDDGRGAGATPVRGVSHTQDAFRAP